jgi:hypothetical protein
VVSAADLDAAVGRFMARVGHWSAHRWAMGGRADRVLALAQVLADAGADVEGRPRRAVPRLEHASSLADQVAVLAADLVLVGAPDPVLRAAAAAIVETTRSL